jgi:hypothetical protein
MHILITRCSQILNAEGPQESLDTTVGSNSVRQIPFRFHSRDFHRKLKPCLLAEFPYRHFKLIWQSPKVS